MVAYYNEHDPFAAQWLRNLVGRELIALGDVDERDIKDVSPDDLRGYTQCHFFAGIGGWSLALRLAGWPDDRPVWTGSGPCQPFSSAGRRGGFADERHLWPAWYHLICECGPPVVFGEQVADKDGLGWLDLVQADLEGAGYACGAADLCAAGVAAPHRRQRLWFVANADQGRRARFSRDRENGTTEHRGLGGVADSSSSTGLERRDAREVGVERSAAERSGETGGLGYTDSFRETTLGRISEGTAAQREGSPWTAADLVPCRDGKWRPVEPGTFPLAHGIPNRVGLLRGYGNAIVPQVAAQFIQAAVECIP